MNSTHYYLFYPGFMAVLLAVSAFFSGTETALFSLSPDSIRRLENRPRLKKVFCLMRRDSAEMLTAILLGNLIVNILFFCTGAAMSERLGQQSGGWIEVLFGGVTLAAIVLFGELIPKAAGVNNPERVLRLVSVPLCLWFHLTLPLRILIHRFLLFFHLLESAPAEESGLTPGELRELLNAVRHDPGFSLQEQEILEEIVNLADVRVREVMIPRVKVFRRSWDADAQEVLREVLRVKADVVLVDRGHDDDSAGYVRTPDLFFLPGDTTSLKALIRPFIFVPETARVDILLKEYGGRDRDWIAVVDEYGGVSGVISVETLLEEVLGGAEADPEEAIHKVDETTYRLNGQISIRAWRDLFAGFLPGPEIAAASFDTLGGLIVSLLRRMPREGDTVTVRNLQMTVETIHYRRIGTVLLHLQSPEERL